MRLFIRFIIIFLLTGGVLSAQIEPQNTLVTPADATVPLVGVPENVHFEPSDTVQFSQISQVILKWDKPLYPVDDRYKFIYKLRVIVPGGYSNDITVNNNTFYKPFTSGFALTGSYIFNVTATLEGLGSSYMVSKKLTILDIPIPTPTPMPSIPAEPDINRDDQTNPLDVYLFAAYYGKFRGQINFNSNDSSASYADFITDDYINSLDLVYFVSLYVDKTTKLHLQEPQIMTKKQHTRH